MIIFVSVIPILREIIVKLTNLNILQSSLQGIHIYSSRTEDTEGNTQIFNYCLCILTILTLLKRSANITNEMEEYDYINEGDSDDEILAADNIDVYLNYDEDNQFDYALYDFNG